MYLTGAPWKDCSGNKKPSTGGLDRCREKNAVLGGIDASNTQFYFSIPDKWYALEDI
jgi:hypothetical protein